jgi:iron complex transport system substrate-binding protein
MKRLNILPFVLLVVLSSLWMGATVISAQDATPETTEQAPIVLPILENLPSAEPDLSTYPVTVENCGRELTFDAPPERVISLWQPPTEILLALGISDRFVALAGTYTTYPDVFTDTVAAIPSIGSGMFWPSREILLSYEPDFVISEGLDSFGYDASLGYATVEEIEASGATVYASAACSYANPESTPRNIDRVLNDIRTLGTIFGVSERAEELIARMEAQRQTVVDAVQGREPVRVAFYNGGQGPLYVLNSSMWADLLVTAGGESVFDPVAFQVSVEEFAAADPEVILMGVYPGQATEDLSAFLQSTFPTLAAVQNGRLYPVETISVENSIRIMYGLETIARALHPDAFADEPAESLAAAAQTQYPVTIETCGRTLTVDAPPQRVYTTYWNGFDLLARLGLADRVVGNAYQGDYDGGELAEQYAQIPNQYERYPAAEEALALQADLVIASYDTFDFPPETLSLEDWTASGVPVYSMSTECGGGDATQARFEMFFDDVRNIGIIFNVQAEAETLIAEMQTRLAAVQTAIGDAQPTTAMIYYGGEGPLNVFTNGVYGSIIELAGGQTVFADAERTVEEVSPEVVASLAPEAYLIIPWTDTFDNLRTFLYATFPDAPATVNDRALLMPDGTTPAGYRTVEAIEQLAQMLHPEAFE